MNLIRYTAYNLIMSLINRGATLVVIVLSFHLLDSETFFELNRFILYIEIFSGLLNLVSKQALLRRRYIFLSEIVVLALIQIFIGFLAALSIDGILIAFELEHDRTSQVYIALFIGIMINITYILESVLKSRNLYSKITGSYTVTNIISLTVFGVLSFIHPTISAIVFIISQKMLVFVSCVGLIGSYYKFKRMRCGSKVLMNYHNKYVLQNFVEGASSAIYRPGMQLIMATYISKESANFIFLALRLLEGVLYQLPLNLSQVVYTNYTSSINKRQRILFFVCLYQFSVFLATITIFQLFQIWSEPAHYFYFSIISLTILPYYILLDSQNTLLYFKEVRWFILLSLLCKSCGIALTYLAVSQFALAGYVYSYISSVMITALLFKVFSRKHQ